MAIPQTISVLDKLRDEMAAHSEDSMICTVGELLTFYAGEHPTTIPALVAEGRNLAGAISAMRDAASKRRKGNTNCVALSMTDGMKAVFEYYGIPYDARGVMQAAFTLADQEGTPMSAAPARAQVTAGLDLDTLLGL